MTALFPLPPAASCVSIIAFDTIGIHNSLVAAGTTLFPSAVHCPFSKRVGVNAVDPNKPLTLIFTFPFDASYSTPPSIIPLGELANNL